MLSVKMKTLDDYAAKMVKECRDGVGNAGETAKSFFKYANKNDMQSQALIAYYSQINKSKFVGVNQVYDAVELKTKRDTIFKRHLGLFTRKLDQKYPETLEKRLAIVANGGVVSDKVNPRSRIRKIKVALDLGFRKLKQFLFFYK